MEDAGMKDENVLTKESEGRTMTYTIEQLRKKLHEKTIERDSYINDAGHIPTYARYEYQKSVQECKELYDTIQQLERMAGV